MHLYKCIHGNGVYGAQSDWMEKTQRHYQKQNKNIYAQTYRHALVFSSYF